MNNVMAVPSIPFLGVTRDGRVMNMITGKWLSIHDNGHGYKQIHTTIGKKQVARYVHRLVAECYIPNPNNAPEVNHKDGNKANNCIDNLEWCTSSDNKKHAFRIGLRVVTEEQKRIAYERLKNWERNNPDGVSARNRKIALSRWKQRHAIGQ